jgi:putative hemolysin
LFLKIGSALELGRSFVRLEYQRQYAPLLLLWKGIARFVAAHPETPVLFGAVSISNEYSSLSREMMVRYFEQREDGGEFADLIQARTPFRAHKLRRWDCGALCSVLRDLDELGEPISDVEEDGKGLPILIKQYAKVGGRLVGFNLDRKFSDVVDGLVIVDLRRTKPSVLERYMGEPEYAGFRRFHGLPSPL